MFNIFKSKNTLLALLAFVYYKTTMKNANILPFQPFSNSNSKLSTVVNLLLIISNLNGKCRQDYLAQAAAASNTRERSSLNRQTLTPCLFLRPLIGLFIEPTAGALGPQIMLPHTALLQWADKNKNSLPSKCLSFGKIREKGWACAKDKETLEQTKQRPHTHTDFCFFFWQKLIQTGKLTVNGFIWVIKKTITTFFRRQEGLYLLKLLVENVFFSLYIYLVFSWNTR